MTKVRTTAQENLSGEEIADALLENIRIERPAALSGSKGASALRAVPEAESRSDARSEPAVGANVPAVSPEAKPSKRRGRRLAVIGALVALIGIGAYFGHDWWTRGRFIVSTDDAYVGADTAVIAPKIAGYVKSVPVGLIMKLAVLPMASEFSG